MNKRLTRTVIMGFCLLAIFAFNGPVYADAELYTPPMTDPSLYVGHCNIVNVSDKTRTVTIEVRDGAGTGAGPTITSPMPPGSAMSIVIPNCTDGCYIYCKFSVQGNKHEYRAAICANNAGCLAAE